MKSNSILSYQSSIEQICRQYHVAELSLFGSRARGAEELGSDFDFLIEFKPEVKVGFMLLGKVQAELENIVKAKVDLIPKGGLKETLRSQVLIESKPIYVAR